MPSGRRGNASKQEPRFDQGEHACRVAVARRAGWFCRVKGDSADVLHRGLRLAILMQSAAKELLARHLSRMNFKGLAGRVSKFECRWMPVRAQS